MLSEYRAVHTGKRLLICLLLLMLMIHTAVAEMTTPAPTEAPAVQTAVTAAPVKEAEAQPSAAPVKEAEAQPSAAPVKEAEAQPSAAPVKAAEAQPSAAPVKAAEAQPSAAPVQEAEAQPSAAPVKETEAQPSAVPVKEAEAQPSAAPVKAAEAQPSAAPVQEDEAQISTDPVKEAGTQLPTGPVLMVTDYSVVEGETVPGSSFVLEMTIANLSEDSSAFNVMATLTVENVSVSLQEGVTNQLYYHEISPMQTVTARFPLEVHSYCSEENMILTMTMSCCDAAVVHYDFQTMMTPNIDVARTLLVGSLTVPQFVHRNSSMIVSATLTNVEPVTLNNIRMHVITQYGEQIEEVGRLLSSESKTVSSIYRFPEQQTEDVQVYFTYESLSGHEYSTKLQKFEVVVYDQTEQNDFVGSDKLSLTEIMESLVQSITVPGTDVQIPIPVIALILIGCAGYMMVLYSVLRRKKR